MEILCDRCHKAPPAPLKPGALTQEIIQGKILLLGRDERRTDHPPGIIQYRFEMTAPHLIGLDLCADCRQYARVAILTKLCREFGIPLKEEEAGCQCQGYPA